MVLEYAWLIPTLPVLAFVAVLFAGPRTPERGGYIALAGIGGAGLLSVLVFWSVWQGHAASFEEPFVATRQWIAAGEHTITFGVYVDNLTALLLLAVGILTTCIALYSLGYMHGEKDGYDVDETHIDVDGRRRYYAELALFVAGMLGFVVSYNLWQAFIFWEVMGLCSYLLIGYWYARPSAAAAAKKAFLVTRVGDVSFLLGIILLQVKLGSVDFTHLFSEEAKAVLSADLGYTTTALLLLFGGAVGKSAQFPLHVWLPDAMEGPTTVSALIHAATMVKAGVFLVARLFPIFALSHDALLVVAAVGAVTAFLTAAMALWNNDLKRVLAFSTISQLAYMFLGLGAAGIAAAGYTASMYHLLNHAFFKALLFLGAGAVGHALHTYDMRELGGLKTKIPLTAYTMLLGCLAIAGVPPFSGFFSKDELLASVYEAAEHDPVYLGLFALGVATAAMTAFYMFRLWWMTFAGSYRGHHDLHHVHSEPRTMAVVLGFLAVWTILPSLWFTKIGDFVFFGHEAHFSIAHLLGSWLTYVSLGAAALGIYVAWANYRPERVESSILPDSAYRGVRLFFYRRMYIDDLYDWASVKAGVGLARLLDWMDRSVIDGVVDGVGAVSLAASRLARRMQTGNVQDYAALLLAGVLAMIAFLIYVANTVLVDTATGYLRESRLAWALLGIAVVGLALVALYARANPATPSDEEVA
ncbi:MAG: NADH-quinone oxidoreductase subunit L [Methanobacteriota archaeon]